MAHQVYVEMVEQRRTRDLRRAVLRPDLPPTVPLPGDELTDAVHFAALDEAGTAVGTCFVYPDRCPWQPERTGAWHLRQMATADGVRSRGIGSAVLEAAVDFLGTQAAQLVWCNAREGALAFYRRHGFVTHGDVFTDERHVIPHQRMWRELCDPPSSSTQ